MFNNFEDAPNFSKATAAFYVPTGYARGVRFLFPQTYIVKKKLFKEEKESSIQRDGTQLRLGTSLARTSVC